MYLKAADRRKEIACEVYFPAGPAEASRILVELYSNFSKNIHSLQNKLLTINDSGKRWLRLQI